MSTPPIAAADLLTPPFARKIQRRSLVIGLVFAVATVIGFFVTPRVQFLHAYLLAYIGWLGLTLGSMAFLMMWYLTGGKWGITARRIVEAGMRTIPLMAALFIPLAAGARWLYDWADPNKVAHSKDLAHARLGYLNLTGYWLRGIVYIVIWLGLAYILSKWSAEQDAPPVRDMSRRFGRLSAPGLILYVFTITFAVIDWVMSLDAAWISTVYGLIYVAGQVLLAICFLVIVETMLNNYEPYSKFLTAQNLKDHGNLMLTFIMLWAYMSFSQLLIIWAGNLPSEIRWYVPRWHGGWQFVGLCLAGLHFAFPFALLLSEPRKRKARRLVKVAIWVFLMRWVDLFWFIEPNEHPRFFVHWLDIVIPVAIGGLWLAYFFRNLRSRPLLALYDPRTQVILEAVHD
ncbi:MAG TPA: hypothetical protein VFI95_01715 [Terriglobales bacterium]|nr:hypothetical protein [Terriglobales bacterium]